MKFERELKTLEDDEVENLDRMLSSGPEDIELALCILEDLNLAIQNVKFVRMIYHWYNKFYNCRPGKESYYLRMKNVWKDTELDRSLVFFLENQIYKAYDQFR